MFPFHRPRVFRSLSGCCICKAKSSSSRFTSSLKYEPFFKPCFALRERRSGVVCNACVLLVKRFKKLPTNTRQNWGHVVDVRAKGKRTKSKEGHKSDNEVESSSDEEDAALHENHAAKYSRKAATPTKVQAAEDTPHNEFLDSNLWRKEKICCGWIFKGPKNTVMIDSRYFTPCCKKSKSLSCDESKESTSDNNYGELSDDGAIVRLTPQAH